jgi:hypothetical protein
MSFLLFAYVYSSTKLEKRAKQVLLGCKWCGGEKEVGVKGRNGPNDVCTYELMNKK